jgi:hypothetical protein
LSFVSAPLPAGYAAAAQRILVGAYRDTIRLFAVLTNRLELIA